MAHGDFELQIGKQASFGTAVTPTAVLWGVRDAKLKPARPVQAFRAPRNNAPVAAHKAKSISADGSSLEGEATYEQLPYLLSMLLGSVTPTGTDPYTYEWEAAAVGKVPSPYIATLRWASDDGGAELTGGVLKSLQFTWAKGEPLVYSGDLLGYDVAAVAARESLAQPAAITPIMCNEFTLYLDEFGTYGTTALAAALNAATLNISPRRAVRHHVTSLYPSGYTEGGDNEGWDVTLQLKLEITTAVRSLFEDVLDAEHGFECGVRLQAVDGTNKLTFDMPGVALDPAQVYEWDDGVESWDLDLTAAYDSVLGSFLRVEVVNDVAALA